MRLWGILKLKNALESPERLAKAWAAGSHSQILSQEIWGPSISTALKFPGDVWLLDQDHSPRTAVIP